MRHYDTGPYKPYEPPPAARCMWATDQRNPYITNINHPIIRAEYAEYCRARGFRQDIPMSDDERLAFDVAMVQKFGVDRTMPERCRYLFCAVEEKYAKKRLSQPYKVRQSRSQKPEHNRRGYACTKSIACPRRFCQSFCPQGRP